MSFGEGNLRTAVAELQAELEQAKQEIDYWNRAFCDKAADELRLLHENDELMLENERLRQLVADALGNHPKVCECELCEMARELGIEVPE